MTRKMGKRTLAVIKANEEYYTKSVISEERPVQLHHVFTFGGKQIDEAWNIVPLTKEEHEMVTPHNSAYIKRFDQMVQWICLMKAEQYELEKYSKVKDLVALRDKLNKEFSKIKIVVPE